MEIFDAVQFKEDINSLLSHENQTADTADTETNLTEIGE
jgi:hypothetical protein